MGEAQKTSQTKPESLRILPDSATLRGGGPFLDPMSWPASRESDPPRALRSLAQIVDNGLCHRCGSCIGICPTGVLSLDQEDYPQVANLSACTDCDLCVRVCPGEEFDYGRANQALFGHSGDLVETHGTFKRAVVAHAVDQEIRSLSTSGGLVTAILLNLLESGQIDGAVVIGSDQATLWKGKPQIARSREAIIGAAKSKYAIAPTNSVFSEIRNTPGRYAVVGLPCQIHGLYKAAELDERIRERVVLSIGLFCHAAIEHEAFKIIWESLGEKKDHAVRFVSRLGKHPGAPHIELSDGSMYPVYHGKHSGYRPSSMEMINILYRLYTPDRCLTCFDALSEFADISIGDPWLTPPASDVDFYEGWSFALLRTERGVKYYKQLLDANKVVEHELTNREAHVCNGLMANEKRWRAFRVIETKRRQGRAIPHYGTGIEHFPQHRGLQFIETELHMLTHVFCYLHRLRGGVLRFFLGSGGYWLLWLNNKRRRFRIWRRDSFEKIRRSLFGRK